jgi:predicted PurR-regulated permease PerM
MDRSERKDTAQHALVYVGIAVTVVIALVLLWYAIDVVLLAFIGVLAAILLRAPADWLTLRCGLGERWSLALVGVAVLGVLVAVAVLFGQGIVAQSLQLADRIPEIIQAFRQKLGESELGTRALALAESSGLFAGGDGQFIGRGLGLIGSTFGAIANVLIVVFFAVFMAAQPRPYVEGALFLVPRRHRERGARGDP